MKILVAISVMVIIAMSSAKPQVYTRGCIRIMGTCVQECEVGTHEYSIDCDFMTPEPTCDEPNPKKEQHMSCDFSGCYCDEPKVRDTVSKKCVTLDKCPKK